MPKKYKSKETVDSSDLEDDSATLPDRAVSPPKTSSKRKAPTSPPKHRKRAKVQENNSESSSDSSSEEASSAEESSEKHNIGAQSRISESDSASEHSGSDSDSEDEHSEQNPEPKKDLKNKTDVSRFVKSFPCVYCQLTFLGLSRAHKDILVLPFHLRLLILRLMASRNYQYRQHIMEEVNFRRKSSGTSSVLPQHL